MKNITNSCTLLRRLVLLLSLALFPILMQAKEGIPLRVMSFNIFHGGMASLDQIGAYINQFHPDVVMLQEVDINTHRENAPSQHDKHFMAELGHSTRMFSAFGKSIPFSGGYYGLGLLSRFPIVRMERVLLPMLAPQHEQRSLLKAIIELDNGRQVSVACTHLDLRGDARVLQVERLNRELRADSVPVIVAGDFNATPESNEIKYGMVDWMRAMADDAYTYPNDGPDTKIDYVFAYPRRAWQVRAARVLPVQMSDHLPIIVDYDLLTE